MTQRIRCEAFGVEFCLVADSEEMLTAMLERAPWGTRPIAEECSDIVPEFAVWRSGEGYCAVADSSVVAEAAEMGEALDAFAHAVMLHVAEWAPEHVFVHAGVVAWRGRALVLPGASFAGKTTLVAELVRAGAVYYSDEFAVLDGEGRVHPYARELGLREPGSEAQQVVRIGELGGVAGLEPVRASHVVFAEYAPGAAWRPEPMPAGMAALEMLRHAVPVQRTPGRVMAAAGMMMEGAKALRSQRGEAQETARALLAMMDGERRDRERR